MTRTSGPGAALVTGATTGIGRELSLLFAKDGHDLVLVARTESALRELAADLTRMHGVRVTVIVRDLAVDGAAGAVYRTLEDAGVAVEHLVNNAGVGLYGEFVSSDLDADLRLIQLNVTSLVALTRLVLPGMIQRGKGRILNVASTAAFLPGPLMAVYYASKAFVLSFSEAIADELRDTGVTLSALCPGPTKTEFQRRAGMQRSKLTAGLVTDAASVALAGYTGMKEGRRVIVPGAMNRMVPLVVRALPRRIVTILSRRAAERTHLS